MWHTPPKVGKTLTETLELGVRNMKDSQLCHLKNTIIKNGFNMIDKLTDPLRLGFASTFVK